MYRVEIKFVFSYFEKDIFGDYWNDKYVQKYRIDDSLIIYNDDNDATFKIINEITKLTEQIVNDKGEDVRVEYVNIIKI